MTVTKDKINFILLFRKEFETIMFDELSSEQYQVFKFFYIEKQGESLIAQRLSLSIPVIRKHLKYIDNIVNLYIEFGQAIACKITNNYINELNMLKQQIDINNIYPLYPDTDAVEMGKRLRKCRKNKKITAEEAARYINLEKKSLYSLENGKTRLGVDQLVALACLYQVSINYIIEGNYICHDPKQENQFENAA